MSTCRLFLLMPLVAALPLRAADRNDDFFETQIRPVLAEKCWSCHGEKKQSSGLRLDSREAIIKGGDSGPAMAPGKPDESRLIQAIRRIGELKMPPKETLPAKQVAALSKWIADGAVWPAAVKANAGTDPAKTHWAFQPVQPPALPIDVNPIDLLVSMKLAESGLSMNPPADPATLIRRLTFDLLGLPPTPEEVDAYCEAALRHPEAATEALVDRLLASPRYGERWARHWLDLARYADTKGYFFEGERRYFFAYTYRDYVIRSLNEDKPYDRFILEQLAADKLNGDPQSLAAMGFLTVGRRFLNNMDDIIDDRIDVIARGLMGLTISCARCHDHKFDPIPTKDYYSLHGVLASCDEPTDLPLIDTPERIAAYRKYEEELHRREAQMNRFVQERQDALFAASRLGVLLPGAEPAAQKLFAAFAVKKPPVNRDKLQKLFTTADREKLKALTIRIEAHKATAPPMPARAMVLKDKPQPVQPHVYVRGNPGIHGPNVPRQFLALLSGPQRKPFTEGSGRLELARAVADPRNPLTARVLVNRVWAHHFGKGLVTTPSDFGMRSEPPSHPELLDWLADRFVRDGWSIKKLHRLILLSATYRQSSADRPDVSAKDPENRLLWKFSRQRLDLESLRDSLLAVSGTLDLTMSGPSVELTREPFIPRRTVYGYIDRQNLPTMFRTFDFASPDTHAPQRFSTMVPQQALYLMNGAFAAYAAKHFVQRSEIARLNDPAERIEAMYRILFGRLPRHDEMNLALSFIDSTGNWERYAQALLLTNEFAFVD